MTKDELKEYCDAEFKNIDRVMTELFFVYSPDTSEYTVTEQAAIATFILNAYNGIENILRQMLIFDKLDTTDSPEWHKKVLKKSAELAILPRELYQVLLKYLSFRNFFVYSYSFNINWEELKVLIEAMKDVIVKFKSEVNEYIQTI